MENGFSSIKSSSAYSPGTLRNLLHSSKLSPLLTRLTQSNSSHTLLKRHFFTIHKSSHQSSVCSVYMSEDLLSLQVEPATSTPKTYSLYDLISVEVGFLKHMADPSSFGFYLVTSLKTLQFSSSSKAERNEWVTSFKKLLQVKQTYNSPNGFKTYWDLYTESQQTQADLSNALNSRSSYKSRIHQQKRDTQSQQFQLISLILDNLVTQVEISAQDPSGLKELKTKAAKCAKISQSRENEIERLLESIQVLQYQSGIQRREASIQDSSMFSLIIPFLAFQDLLSLGQVSTLAEKSVKRYLALKSNWRKMGKLIPRKIGWKQFINRFYLSQIRTIRTLVSPEVYVEINRDVVRVPDSHPEVEGILISLCSHNPETGYCQGMQQVVHFLLSKLQNSQEVLKIMLSVMNTPYFMGDVWKQGFPRLKIAIFQLECLIKLKLPALYKFFKKIELNLDIVISSWLLTLFVHLHSQQGFPIDTIEYIWDLFLVQGWPVVISTCLALLFLSQPLVIGRSIEYTIDVYTNSLPFENLEDTINLFNIDLALLDDLERAFYLNE